MISPSSWGVLRLDQLRGLTSAQLQLTAAAAISNMPIPSFSSSSSEGDLSEISVAYSLEATIPESIHSLKLGFPITVQANISDLSPTARTFPKFKELAVEVRDMIWKFSLPGPRIVDIIYNKDQDKYLSFHSKPPSLLHTNREARYVAQKIYNLCFETQSNLANIYIRFDTDIIYFANWLTGYKYAINGWFEHVNIGPIGKKGLGKHDLRSIQRVAVNSVYFDTPEYLTPVQKMQYFLRSVTPILDRFYSLKKLYVVVEDIDPYLRGEITFVAIPDDCHLHPEFCVFGGASEIVKGLEDLKWHLTSPWKIPAVSVVGAARSNHVSHMGQYQMCECNGLIPLQPGRAYRNHPCEAYHPNPDKTASVVAEDEGTSGVEDDLPEEDWGLSEDELKDLIADEYSYHRFIEKYCQGKYGVNHEQWLGADYDLRRFPQLTGFSAFWWSYLSKFLPDWAHLV
ncbi:hypothetical protein SBOR_0477 [Sclerotinia borealis F-4128]|uniref:2EXR domain-containing protein n=1 Tax=Sclerotinia borealis (strain F-4128) TaxID=1432307 RepID=W9CQG0_SCLBF|nr:hypothetical protein SBOR_0477 [Sclerotinia borealis F-4128]